VLNRIDSLTMRRVQWTTVVIACAAIAMSLSLFLPWYSVRRSPAVGPGLADGWLAFSHIDLGIVGAGVVALRRAFFLGR